MTRGEILPPHNLEFHRGGCGLLPELTDEKPGYALYLRTSDGSAGGMVCTCADARRSTCRHRDELVRQMAAHEAAFHPRPWGRTFDDSFWGRLARLLFEGDSRAADEVVVTRPRRGPRLRFGAPGGGTLLEYRAGTPDATRLLERLGKMPDEDTAADRADLLDLLARLQRSPQERLLNERGARTRRQVLEAGFWHRLAYHGRRELGDAGATFHPAVDEATGDFVLRCRARHGGETEEVFALRVPRQRVGAALGLLAEAFPGEPGIAIHPVPLESLTHLARASGDRVELRPVLRLRQDEGGERLLRPEELEKFRYGDLVYLPGAGVLARLGGGDRLAEGLRQAGPRELERGQVPSFLDEHAAEIAAGTVLLDPSVGGVEVFRGFDRLALDPVESPEQSPDEGAPEKGWTWLSLSYGVGNEDISLGDILRARQERRRYLETAGGWLDLSSPAFATVLDLLHRAGEAGDLPPAPPAAGEPTRLRLSRLDLLRLATAAGRPVEVAGEGAASRDLRRLLAFQPAAPYAPPPGLEGRLRPYQRRGVEWLLFLAENGLSGLLCDDMGLGKTHQAMALMLCLRQRGAGGPFLVVAPRTVLSHWASKLEKHAPGLAARLYHGAQRDLGEALAGADVLLTSYGILRNDAEELSRVGFALAVFDEIQHAKSRDTATHQAARRLRAAMRLGLTGTPIENTVEELKNLFDLVLPGYLGSDAEFRRRFPTPETLRHAVAPFVLRRLKTAVLDELPEKIEDVRTCELSGDQIKLYRDALASRAEGLRRALLGDGGGGGSKVPYIHIFALLNLLKQICDHPALVAGDTAGYRRYASGKWDLFTELLEESLEAGQKVVVFSQYLGMIDIMARHLAEIGVDAVTLTGASERRGEIIARFNTDPECRVFLGSLKAGGTGIDLVGGSVVIHYDRWWNAAREEQATDRVYRMGQRRAVQVFKLVSAGTLEEKIHRVIERKRRLMDSVIQPDDPHLAKIFTREELLDLLAPPASGAG